MKKVTKSARKKRLGSYPYFSVVSSITFALFVLGLFGLLGLHISKLTQLIQENMQVQVYLTKSVTPAVRTQLEQTLASKAYVATSDNQPRITFISKEEAAEDFTAATGENFKDFLGENPLRDAFLVNIKPEYQSNLKLDSIRQSIEEMNGVFEAVYVENLVSSINQNLAKLSIALGGFAIVLILVVVILINNTIKLALFSQRFLIRSMQLVGATSNFIQLPFLARSIFLGFLAGVLSCGLLFGLMQYANQQIADLVTLQNLNNILILFAILLLLGSLIGFLSTLRAVRKYLAISLDDLY